MAGGLASRNGRRRRVGAEINVVPYIDVMLVLLVIFMVTAPMLTQGVDVELPSTSANTIAAEEEPVTLFVDGAGKYYLDVGADHSAALSDADVVDRIGAVLRNKPKTMVLVRADKAVPYDRVANGMSLLQQAGAGKLGFVTDAPSGAPAKTPARK